MSLSALQNHTISHLSSACAQSLSRGFVTSWTVAHQAPLSMEFSWQEDWGELSFPPPLG